MKSVKGSALQRARAAARDDRGLSTVEYIIILVLIAVAGIGLWRTFGDTVAEKIGNATSEVGGL
jgi:Flp pilus assembly pilin Flp